MFRLYLSPYGCRVCAMTNLKLIIEPDAGCPDAAEVLVSGKVCQKDYVFLLDTGASASCIKYDAFTSQFPAAGRHGREGMFSGSAQDVIIVPEIKFGDLVKKDFRLTRAGPEAAPARNLLGADFLKDYCCHFDFGAGDLVLEEEHSSASLDRELILDDRAHPFIRVEVDGSAIVSAFDTGAGLTLVALGFIKTHEHLFREAGQADATDSVGASAGIRMFRMQPFHIARLAIPEQLVIGLDLAKLSARTKFRVDMVIGYNTMSLADWVLDFPHRRWSVSSKPMPAGSSS